MADQQISATIKLCKECLVEKPITEFYLYNSHNIIKRRLQCKSCYNNTYRVCSAKYQEKLRNQAIFELGGKCVACGYDNPLAITIDHVDGDGCEARRNGHAWSKFYREIIDGTHKRRVQLLCANCNQIKKRELKEYGND